jgi:cytochrome c
VGPAFVSVAERYESLDDPVAYLSVTIRQGGRGRWGAVPMPAQSQVSEDEARRLAQWILSLRK